MPSSEALRFDSGVTKMLVFVAPESDLVTCAKNIRNSTILQYQINKISVLTKSSTKNVENTTKKAIQLIFGTVFLIFGIIFLI